MTSTESPETETTAPTGIDLTETQDGGVLKEILQEGSGDERPAKGDKVTVHYVGTLLDGSLFDSSRNRGDKFTFTLGKGEVIKAWDIGVASMRKGELAKLTCKAEYAYGEMGSPPKIPPGATLVFEVELFYWHGEDISEKKDQGIIRSILTAGSGFQTPSDYARVTIKYSLKHEARLVQEEKEVTFTLGEVEDTNIVPGLETAVKKMKEKEKARFTIASAYAYGDEGNKEFDIPAGATLTYEVELVSFEKAKRVYEMNSLEKLDQADIRKAKGTDFFKKGLTHKALANYNTILDYLDSETTLEGEEKARRDALVLAARLNLAACELKLGSDSKVIEHCNEALEISSQNAKAFFRRAQAYQNRKEYDSAEKDFQMVLTVEPENKAAKNQIAVCKRKQQEDLQKEKKLYAGMFKEMTKQSLKNNEQLSNESIFKDGVGEWDNNMAAGMLPLDQEVAAFGDVMPTSSGNNNGNNHHH